MAGLLGMWAYYTALKMEANLEIVPIAACLPFGDRPSEYFGPQRRVTLHRVLGTALIVSGIWLVK